MVNLRHVFFGVLVLGVLMLVVAFLGMQALIGGPAGVR